MPATVVAANFCCQRLARTTSDLAPGSAAAATALPHRQPPGLVLKSQGVDDGLTLGAAWNDVPNSSCARVIAATVVTTASGSWTPTSRTSPRSGRHARRPRPPDNEKAVWLIDSRQR